MIKIKNEHLALKVEVSENKMPVDLDVSLVDRHGEKLTLCNLIKENHHSVTVVDPPVFTMGCATTHVTFLCHGVNGINSDPRLTGCKAEGIRHATVSMLDVSCTLDDGSIYHGNSASFIIFTPAPKRERATFEAAN